ncbi:MAG TPA: hypothetical protein VNL14_16400 [Candidatus Acidoferrales bacterium]|nr:hypothetical protein [Candidatus Acidoferrales bacterium]
MSGVYAKETSVPVERSRAEIEKLLRKYGADQFYSGWKDQAAAIGFRIKNRYCKFILPLPKADEKRFTHFKRGRSFTSWIPRSPSAAKEAYEQEVRRRWRALALVIKAKLEAVESGITTFEHEFMAHFVMPDGKTFAEHAMPAIEQAYATGKVPALLPGLSE